MGHESGGERPRLASRSIGGRPPTLIVRSAYRPHVVLAGGSEGAERPELLRERPAVEGRPAAYVCEHFACRAPVTDPQELAAQLG